MKKRRIIYILLFVSYLAIPWCMELASRRRVLGNDLSSAKQSKKSTESDKGWMGVFHSGKAVEINDKISVYLEAQSHHSFFLFDNGFVYIKVNDNVYCNDTGPCGSYVTLCFRGNLTLKNLEKNLLDTGYKKID